ncbi:MAG: hypothetical protein NVSMB10_09470 [Steroidobacteraceae bacterium]
MLESPRDARAHLTYLTHRFELRLAVLAMAVLLLAQAGALSHAYSHDVAFGAASSQPAVPGEHDACRDCLGFAPLLSAGALPVALPGIESPGRGVAICAAFASIAGRTALHAFRSRAPPRPQ